jgi:transcriptional regulator
MYLPPQFAAKDRAHALTLMHSYPFASLISTDAEGLPFVSHLPLHLEQQGEQLVLLGHCARPNPHWRYLQQRPRAVASFLGPHAYLSPQVYPDLARVPSWNYLAVHCTVQARLIEEPRALDGLLKKLIGDHEPAYAQQWRALGESFAHKMMAGIVGFELQVIEMQCKLKLNQHRPEAHTAMRAMYAQGGEDEQALGQWMDRLGLGAAAVKPGDT